MKSESTVDNTSELESLVEGAKVADVNSLENAKILKGISVYFKELNNSTIQIARKTAELADYFRRLTLNENKRYVPTCVGIFKVIADKLQEKSASFFSKLLSGPWLLSLLASSDYKQAFEAHTFLAGVFLKYPEEGLLKPILEAIMLKSDSEEIRYKLSMYFFVLLWRTPLAAIKKLLTKIEDSAIYLGPDECEEVRDTLCMAMIVLRSREETYYKKCLKLMRRSVVDMIESAANQYSQVLLERLKLVDFDEFNHFSIRQEDGRPHGKGADYKIVQLCPISFRTISSYLECVEPDTAQEEMRMSSRFANNYSHSHQDDDDSDEEPERDDYIHDSRINSVYSKATREKFKKYKNRGAKPPTITEYTEDSRDSRRPLSTAISKKSFNSSSRIKTENVFVGKGSRIRDQNEKKGKVVIEDYNVKSPEQSSTRKSGNIIQESRAMEELDAPPSADKIKIEHNQVPKVTRFEDEGNQGYGYQQDQYYRPQVEESDEEPNDYLINEDLRMILEGNGKKIPTKLSSPKGNLYNEGVVKLIEDIIMGGERDDLIKLHAYFSTLFHREPSRMVILNNILDACMYYLTFEQGPFKSNTKMVITVLYEYLRGSNLLGMTLLYADELVQKNADRIPNYLKLVKVVIEVTAPALFDQHLMTSVFGMMNKNLVTTTKSLLEVVREKNRSAFDKILPRFPELKSVYEEAHPLLSERLYLLHTIPHMPELSPIKRVELAVSCCRGSRKFDRDRRSHYRFRKFRDQALLFFNSQRFYSDLFDSQGAWLQDLEDCETLFDAQAMINTMAVGVKKSNLRINQATPNDWLVTIAEFSRRILFDEDAKQDAVVILKSVLLAMKSNGIANYTQLFHPQEITVITGC